MRGQNFLRSPETAERLVRAVGVEARDAVVEIGPGLGQLTRPLARAARRTVAIEVDRGLVEYLREQDLGPGVEIRHQDALKTDLTRLGHELGPPVVLVGNLPYRISGRLLGQILVPDQPFRRWGLMVQAEVADRLLAEPGSGDYGILSVWVRLLVRGRRAVELGPSEFVPRPKVRSTFLVFDPVPEIPLVTDWELLRRVVRAAFRHRRKTLRRALTAEWADVGPALERAEIDPSLRADRLSERDFARLANALAAARAP